MKKIWRTIMWTIISIFGVIVILIIFARPMLITYYKIDSFLRHPSCYNEGEVIPFQSFNGCCKELKRAPFDLGTSPSRAICIKCGDGICNTGEDNFFGCPQDCKELK